MVLSERRESNGLFYAVGPVNPVAMFFVHILRTVSSSLYIGVTQKLDQRISTHKAGRERNGSRPIEMLIWCTASLIRR